jgi:hypothetical protein
MDIKFVIPARPESFFTKEGFPSSGNDMEIKARLYLDSMLSDLYYY